MVMQIAGAFGVILAFIILMVVSSAMQWPIWLIIIAVLLLFVAATYGMAQITIRTHLKKLAQEDDDDEAEK